MISKKKLKEFANSNYSKKIGKESIKIIEKKSADFIHELLKKASKKAEFSGRTTIKPEDLE
ncbi:MAG: NFYB/HAP3 family transcription factor subunit [Nanoarchaeota archaeon]|nr:NFYB/HAP3 family transcription factor subunit [Nanoarchaeota archaeon]